MMMMIELVYRLQMFFSFHIMIIARYLILVVGLLSIMTKMRIRSTQYNLDFHLVQIY